MKFFKKSRLIAGGVALLLGLALLLTASLLPRKLLSQREAERWAGESGKRFKQLTAVLSPGSTLEPETVYAFRETALKKIAESEYDLPAGGTGFCDAWSTGGTAKVSGPRGSFDAAALAVGGRFFEFHPMALLSGGFLSESDLMKDRVVLDEQLAWMLFGGTDLAGMTVRIGEQEFFVAGVVARQNDRFTRAVSEQAPTIYLNYEARPAIDTAGGITCYEVVLPDPVKGFAKDLVDGAFAKQGVVVENTERFSFAASLRFLRGISSLGVRTKAVAFPTWENAAVAAETACALLRCAALLCLVWPAVLLIAALYRLARLALGKLKGGGRAAKEALLDRRDQRRERRLERRYGQKE